MIELRDIRKVFNAGRPSEITAVDGVTLGINEGSFTVLKGPSGSGKTTLLSIIGCMARPTAGRITLGGKEITSLPERFLTGIRRSTFGFIFQSLNLIRGITALENIVLPAYPTGEVPSSLLERGRELLTRFSLAHKAAVNVELLSGGEAQRVAIARALINGPSVIIADEPTAHLDTALSHDFMRNMEVLNAEGKTIIIASHDPIVYDSPAADRIVDMRDGRLCGQGQKS